ncbi:MAG: hypothetical protein RMZ69_13685 [Nostoc sp. ChiQUE01a]|nr:hypothetical protein [Nostoc sp. ChiQUE01a]
MFIRITTAIANSSTKSNRLVFEVFCKAIAHSSKTGDRSFINYYFI